MFRRGPCSVIVAASLWMAVTAWPVWAQPQPAVAAASVPAVASPPAPAAAPATAARPGNEPVNPYGLEALWRESDPIARSVLVLLAIMSAGSWYILAIKLIEQARLRRSARAAEQNFWQAPSVRDGAAALAPRSAYRYIAESGARAMEDHQGLKRHIPLQDWTAMRLEAAVHRVQASTQGGLAFLATVGATSPFVGLFGTVWGIYHALTAIGVSGQASIDKVAGPVGEALIMTAIGLAVAIPAVLAYNWLARRNKALMDEVREFSDEVMAVIAGSSARGG